MWCYGRSSYLSSCSASSHVAEKACSNVFTQQDRQWLLRPLSPASRASFKWAKLRQTRKDSPECPYQSRCPSKTAGRTSETSEQLRLHHLKVWGWVVMKEWVLPSAGTLLPLSHFHFHLAPSFCWKWNLRIGRSQDLFSKRAFWSMLLSADGAKYESLFHQ